jgi:hypothetical protein
MDRFACPCERERRLQERFPLMAKDRPYEKWEWREKRGCDKPAAEPVVNFEGENLFSCPVALIENWQWELLRLYNLWERGLLPDEGSVLSQTAQYLDAMAEIETAKVEFNRQERVVPKEALKNGAVVARNPVRPSRSF